MNGLCACARFEVNEIWSDGKLVEKKIISKLGGNLHTCSSVPLSLADVTDLNIAAGENPNPFFAAPPVRPAFVSHFIETQTAGKVSVKEFVYDIPTNAGEMIELKTR